MILQPFLNGSLSQEYYEGWSKTLVSESQKRSQDSVTILPCVYVNYHDNYTLKVLIKEDVSCHGLWIARYHDTPHKNPSWNTPKEKRFAVPKIIRDSSIPVFLRQYARDAQIKKKFDLDQTNPNIADIQGEFLDKLILPPAGN